MDTTQTNPNPWTNARASRLANCIDLAFRHPGADLAREAWAQSQREDRPFDAEAFEVAHLTVWSACA